MSTEKKRAPTVVAVIVCLIVIGAAFWMGYSTAQSIHRYEGASGFRLPPGDEVKGMLAFTELGCVECHSVAGSAAFPKPDAPPDFHVVLGGKVHVVRTYGELVTAILHPSESIRPEIRALLETDPTISPMPDYSQVMSTRQLVDLVTWLEAQYEVTIPEYTRNYYPYDIDLVP